MSRKANNIDVLKADLIILKIAPEARFFNLKKRSNRAAGAIFLKGKCHRSRFSFRKTDQIRVQSGSGVRENDIVSARKEHSGAVCELLVWLVCLRNYKVAV